MKTIASWGNMQPYGIIPLTGEACGLMYRILFDVTASGEKVVERCFGIPDMKLGEAWNRGTKEAPHVGSIMLTQEMLIPFAVFALLENGCREAYLMGGVVLGIEADDPPDAAETMRKVYRVEHARRFSYGGEYAKHYPVVHSLSGIRDNHPSWPLSPRPVGRSRSVRCRNRS